MQIDQNFLWTSEELTLLKLMRTTFSKCYQEISDMINDLHEKGETGFPVHRSPEAVRKCCRRQGLTDRDLGINSHADSFKVEELDGETVNISQRQAREMLGDNNSKIRNPFLELVRNAIHQARDEADLHKIPSIPVESNDETLIIQLSDIHIGKVIVDSETGKEIYNSKIAVQRIKDLLGRIGELTKYIRKTTRIDEAIVALAGDIVDSETIYDTQPHHIDIGVRGQVKFAVSSLWGLIKGLSEMFPKVRVVAARGNHGRVSQIGSEESNWDNVIYDQLGFIIDENGCENISMQSSVGEHLIFEVKGKRGMLLHNGPKHGDGSPQISKTMSWGRRHNIDFMLYGHWHHWGVFSCNGIVLFRNGSMCGSDDLADRMAAYDDPHQLVFGVSRKRIPTFLYTLDFR